MKRIFAILFLCILFASCEKEIHNGYSELIMNVPKTQNTKTHLVPNVPNRLFDVVWDDGDQVKVFDQNGGEGIYTNLNVYDDNNNEVAHFGGDGVDITSTLTAFYPVSIASSNDRFILPYEQTYRTKSDGYMLEYPMWAKETNNHHMWFRNLTGILILRVQGKTGVQIRKVYVKEPADPSGPALRGTYGVSCNGSTHTNEPSVFPVSPEYDVVLNCTSNPITLVENESSLFYISVPPAVHSRLLIGLEYKMSNSSNWVTTYQIIFAKTYNEQHFKFERTKWTPIDVDFSELDGSLLYFLKNININPNQNGDTVINTSMPLTSSFGQYTFAIDITPDDISSLDNSGYIRKTIYSEMDNVSSNWNGVIIRLARQDNVGTVRMEVQIGSSTSVFTTQALNSGVRHQFVVTINNYSNTQGVVTIYFKRNGSITNVNTRFTKTKWVTTTNPVPEIGGDQHISGRYYDGQIHSFRIYDRVWTTQEIRSFINQ